MEQGNPIRPSLVPIQTYHQELGWDEKPVKRPRPSFRPNSTDNDRQYLMDDDMENSAPRSKFGTAASSRQHFCISGHNGTPLPPLKWANRDQLWNSLCQKERSYVKDPNLLQRHPISCKMRAVLFEWISEVSEVYKLHRETFYLSMDFVDRYLSIESEVPKYSLQLVGVTALFIAAKLEEIYPPQVKDFAYVTDSACTVEEILEMELVMLKTLSWALCPITVNHWLMLYLQIVADGINANLTRFSAFSNCRTRNFTLPQFQRLDYIRLTQLTDLCMLDPGVLRFPYSVVAASAFFHTLQPMHWTFQVSGYTWSDLESCLKWMSPFAQAIKDEDVNVKIFPDIPNSDMHNIQIHFVRMSMLENAHLIAQAQLTNIFPTPPSSGERAQQHISRLPGSKYNYGQGELSNWSFNGSS